VPVDPPRSSVSGFLRRTSGASEVNNPATAHVDWVSKLDGIWGFTIWDSRRQELILCRDPLGVKPLLRTLTPSGELLVASEAKAFRAHPDYVSKIDENAMLARLAFEYSLDETTLFEGVSQVAPATIETWSLDSEGRATLTGVATYTSERVTPGSMWNSELDAQDLLDSLCERFDAIFIGGAMANTFLYAKKINIGKSYIANEADTKYFKETFESILFDDGFFSIFKMNKIKKFILAVI
jgi:hypothetical protein